MTEDQYDSYTFTDLIRRTDLDERLQLERHLPSTPSERTEADVEGWIIGIEFAGRITPKRSRSNAVKRYFTKRIKQA